MSFSWNPTLSAMTQMSTTQVQLYQVQVGDNYCTNPLKGLSVLPSKIVICVMLQGCTVQGLNSVPWQGFCLIIFGEAALLAIQWQSSRSWNEAEKGFMIHTANIFFVDVCLINPSYLKPHPCCPCISKLIWTIFLTQLVHMGCAGIESVLRMQCWAQSRSHKIAYGMVETLSYTPTFCISCNNSRKGAKCVKQTYLVEETPTPVFLCK